MAVPGIHGTIWAFSMDCNYCVAIRFLKVQKNKEKLYLLFLLLMYLVLAIFLMLPISNSIWERIILLQNFQFPWRFLAIIVFSTSVLGALLIDAVPNKFKAKLTILSIIIILAISSSYWKAKRIYAKTGKFLYEYL